MPLRSVTLPFDTLHCDIDTSAVDSPSLISTFWRLWAFVSRAFPRLHWGGRRSGPGRITEEFPLTVHQWMRKRYATPRDTLGLCIYYWINVMRLRSLQATTCRYPSLTVGYNHSSFGVYCKMFPHRETQKHPSTTRTAFLFGWIYDNLAAHLPLEDVSTCLL